MKRRGRPPYPDVLTPRQWEVLALLRAGLSNEEIAQRLGISVDGAKFHVSEILGKLGVTSRNEAARWEREERQPAPSAVLAHRAGRRTRFGREHRGIGCDRRRAQRVAPVRRVYSTATSQH